MVEVRPVWVPEEEASGRASPGTDWLSYPMRSWPVNNPFPPSRRRSTAAGTRVDSRLAPRAGFC